MVRSPDDETEEIRRHVMNLFFSLYSENVFHHLSSTLHYGSLLRSFFVDVQADEVPLLWVSRK